MSTGECISRLVALEGQVCLLRHQLHVEGKWRRRIESWLCRRFDDYEREDADSVNDDIDIKEEDNGEGGSTENYDSKSRNVRGEVDEDDGYEGSDTKVNSTLLLVAASKDKRRLSSQSDEYHHDNYDVEVDDEDMNQEDVCEDLSPKRFKLHHPPPPLQKRPDLPPVTLQQQRERHEDCDNKAAAVPLVVDSRTVHKGCGFVKQQQQPTTFVKQEEISEGERHDQHDKRHSEEMPWKDNEEVEVINVEPCLDMEYDYDDDEEEAASQEHWENSNGYSADEDETGYEESLMKANEAYTAAGSRNTSTACNKYILPDKHMPSSDSNILTQTLNSSGPPKLISIKSSAGVAQMIKLKSLNQRPVNSVNSSVPTSSHPNSLLKNYSPFLSSKGGSSKVVSLSEVYAQAKMDRSRLNQWNQMKAGQQQPRVVVNGSPKQGAGLLKKSITYDQLQNRSILDMSSRNKQPGECPHCGKTFNTPAEMMRHTRIHTGEKPYKCYACTYATSFNGDLVRHLKSRHPGMDPYVCHLCDFKCQELLMFNNHRRKTGHGGRGSSNLNVKDPLYSAKAEASSYVVAESENF